MICISTCICLGESLDRALPQSKQSNGYMQTVHSRIQLTLTEPCLMNPYSDWILYILLKEAFFEVNINVFDTFDRLEMH